MEGHTLGHMLGSSDGNSVGVSGIKGSSSVGSSVLPDGSLDGRSLLNISESVRGERMCG